MGHNRDHIIIQKLKAFIEKYPKSFALASLVAGFGGGAWIF